MDKDLDDIQQTPLFKKAMEISELGGKIANIVSKDDIEFDNPIKGEMLERHAGYIAENSSIIPAKIVGAEGGDLYGIRMENAAIIRKAAREIMTDCTGLKMYGFKEIEYLELLRNEIEDFRVLFAEWVKSFDCWNYIIDRWGLFNPPGVEYNDKDPDDDLPFDPSDFFGID